MTGDCTDCPFPGSYLPYSPSLPGNAFLLAAFAALIPTSLFLGYRFPSLGFTLNFVTALCLEVLGFVGRLLLRNEGGSRAFFALYLLGSVLGTTAFASALFVVLPHMLGVYEGRGVRGARVAVGFMGLLVVIIVLEIAGVAFAVFGLGGVAVSTIQFVAISELGSNVGCRIRGCWWPGWRCRSWRSRSSWLSTPGSPSPSAAYSQTRSTPTSTRPPDSSDSSSVCPHLTPPKTQTKD